MTFEAPSYRHPDIYVLQVLSNILGGGMSSRLFQEVREKRGLCYSVFSFGSAYEDAGQMGVYAATSPEHSNELLDLTAEVMLSVAREVTEAEVARAKSQLKASLVMNLESASSRADQIAHLEGKHDVHWFAPEGAEGHELWPTRMSNFERILEEDVQFAPRIQESVEARGFSGMVLSYQERRIYHWHEELDRRIGIEMCPFANLQIKGFPSHAIQAGNPRSLIPSGSSATARLRPMVAIEPLST